MRKTAMSLVTAVGLGAAFVGGRGIAADRASTTPSTSPVVETRSPSTDTPLWNGGTLAPIVVEATAPARRLWYGGTLAPIVVQGSMPSRLSGRSDADCPTGGR